MEQSFRIVINTGAVNTDQRLKRTVLKDKSLYLTNYYIEMDINKLLGDTEISLRNLISYKLNKLYGEDWINKCGISTDKISKWESRRIEEEKKIGSSDSRIIYYSEFYELLPILKKHWSECFYDIFGKFNKFELLWEMLEGYRNPDAHKRGFLPYQINLIAGITGKIRTEITKYFSKMDTGESYFPRFESAQDNLGNMWTYGQSVKGVITSNILRPGDILQFTMSGFDPLGEELLFQITSGDRIRCDWSEDTTKTVEIVDSDIRKEFTVFLYLNSKRNYHAHSHCDDWVCFNYVVLPIP